MVYYRKYRSQTIAELDSPKLRETLYSVLSSQNVPHAFLFTGPKGLGKTSTARIIAKVLNCQHTEKPKSGKEAIEPDNVCEQCVSIANGSNIDVLEIDGASNRGIDEIRDLRDRVKLAPSAAHKKVYIIDEVHMLTTEAFNALLKTIEEPPSHVVFIFCTTEPQKVPATIVSRCFHISLSRATEEEIVHALQRIVTGEKLDVDEDALKTIAKMADGGYRDATKLLEEVVALSNGQKITKAIVEEQVHVSGVSQLVADLLSQLEKKSAKDCLDTIQEIIKQGTDVKYLISEVMSALHALLLQKVRGEETQFSLEEIHILVELLSDAYQKTKYAVVQSLPLELAVVQFCSLGSVGLPNPQTSEAPADTGKHTMDTMLKKERNLKVQVVLGKAPAPQPVKKQEDSPHAQVDLPKNVNDVASLMENLIYKVKPYNHSVAGVLRGCTINAIDEGKIVFATAYKFHKERLEEMKTKEILEKAIREITGKPIQVMVELKK